MIVRLKRRLASALATPAPTPTTPTSSSIPRLASGSVRAFLLCIHPFEEPSWNTVAGGLGFVSPPSSYAVTPTMHAAMDGLVRQYGDSWPSWPEEAQLSFGAALYAAYGPTPWSTAYHCS